MEWRLEYFIPFSLLEKWVGSLGLVLGQQWHANLYKCGDETSHPHWAAWAPVDEFNFHLPRCFGTIQFEDSPPVDPSHNDLGEHNCDV